MATLTVHDNHVEVELSLVERIGSLRRQARYPLDSIVSVRRVDVARREITGLRAPGTYWPGSVALGTWRKRWSKSFVAVRGKGPGYVIELDNQDVDRLIVESPPIGALDSWTPTGGTDG